MYQKTGRFEEASADFSRAIDLGDNIAYYNRGNAYYYSGDYDKAIPDYNRVLQFDSQNAEAYNARGAAHERQGNLEQGLRDREAAGRLDPRFREKS